MPDVKWQIHTHSVYCQSFCVSVISWNFSFSYSYRVSGIIVDDSPSSAAVNNRDWCNTVFGDMNNLFEMIFFARQKRNKTFEIALELEFYKLLDIYRYFMCFVLFIYICMRIFNGLYFWYNLIAARSNTPIVWLNFKLTKYNEKILT